MKKEISLFLSLLLFLTACCMTFTACGTGEQSPEAGHTDTDAETEGVRYDEFGRPLVPSSLPDDLSFGGETVTILLREHTSVFDARPEFISEGLNSEPVNDAVFTRSKEVEDRLKIKLDYNIVGGSDYAPYMNAVRKSWQAGDHSFDIMAYYAYYGVSMATEGMLANLTARDEYLDLSKPWWNHDFVDEMTLFDQLYFVVGDLSLTATQCTVGVFFNKKLLNDLFRDTDLYTTVQNGDWTMDTFSSMIASCYFDVNGDGKRGNEDRYGAMLTAVSIPMDAYILAFDVSITEKDEDGIPCITFDSDRAVNAFDKLYEMIRRNEGSLFAPCVMDYYYEAQEKFTESETLFLLDFFQATNTLREMTVDYGVLPLFKYDKAQSGYYTTVSDTYSLLSIFEGSAVPDQAEAVMELMAQKSYERVTPAYFEISLKQKYSQSNNDAQMFDLTLAGRRFNFGFVYSYELGNPTHLWRSVMQSPSNNLSSTLKGSMRTYRNGLKKLVAKYEKMAG